MEWTFENEDLFRFLKLSENQFRSLLNPAESDQSDPSTKNRVAVAFVDANVTLEKYINDIGFCSRQEVETKSKQDSRSLLSRIEHLHCAAKKAKKDKDYVSGFDIGELQERIVESFMYCLDQDVNYLLGKLQDIAVFETLLKCILRDSPSVSWLKWQLDLSGSSIEEAQVPDINYDSEGASCVNVDPEYDIMLSVSHTELGLENQEQSIIETKCAGFFRLSVIPHPSDDKNDLLKLITVRDSMAYLSASKFRNEILRIFTGLTLLSHTSREDPEIDTFEMTVTPHGPAVQVDEKCDFEQFTNMSYDLVLAIKFDGWPKCVQEWVERKRFWPHKALVKEITRDGFHLVPKTSPQGDEELDWRISFSRAEVKLMRSKGLGNRNYCYRIFKLAIKENILSTCTVLNTYHLKTLLLWASERHPPDSWSDENIAVCFLGLIDDLLHSLVNRSCPHYFIPGLNLFANCSTDHLQLITRQVSAIRKFPLKYLQRPGEDPKEGYDIYIKALKEWKEMDYGEI